jgi:putative ABC transport system substrate-binding protein
MEFGNLMSYGPDLDELFRHSTKYVDKIVRGTNPSDLPVEFPTRYPLISINKTAMALNLTIHNH